MSEHIKLAIEDLEQKLVPQIAAVVKTKSAINLLLEMSGEPPRYPDVSDATIHPGGTHSTRHHRQLSIKPDEFYGRPLSAAVRQVLQMRKTVDAHNGPASVDDIHELLTRGGFAFEARDQDNQIRGLGVSISKNSALFARLPNGLVGLAEWYDKKRPKSRNRSQPEQQEREQEEEESEIHEPANPDATTDNGNVKAEDLV